MRQELQDFRDRLRSYGMKLTPQRLAVFNILTNTTRHPDAESIFSEVRKALPSMSLATVYSTLKSLKKIGIVQEVRTLCDSRHFDGNVQPHLHLVCISCNKIEDLHKLNKKDIEDLEKFVAKKTSYKIIRSCLSFYGYCSSCKEKSGKKIHK